MSILYFGTIDKIKADKVECNCVILISKKCVLTWSASHKFEGN